MHSEVPGQSEGSSCGVHAPEVCFGLGCCIRPDESARYSEQHNKLGTRQTTSRYSCIASTAAERQDSRAVHGPLLLLHAAWDEEGQGLRGSDRAKHTSIMPLGLDSCTNGSGYGHFEGGAGCVTTTASAADAEQRTGVTVSLRNQKSFPSLSTNQRLLQPRVQAPAVFRDVNPTSSQQVRQRHRSTQLFLMLLASVTTAASLVRTLLR